MSFPHLNLKTPGLAVLFFTLLLYFPHTMAAQQTWIFKSAEVLDITTGNILSDHDVLVENGVISEIAKNIRSPEAKKIPAKNHYLVPGWVEMHAHIPPAKVSQMELDELLFLYSAHGITTVRGMLGASWHLELKAQLRNNEIHGPMLVTSGPSFNGQSVNSPSYAKGRVKAQFEKGYDFLKVHPGMSDAEYQAMATTANSLGLDYSGHVTAATGLLESARIGQGTIDHLDGVIAELAKRSGKKNIVETGFFGSALVNEVDHKQIPKLAKELASTGVALVPTESLMVGFVSPVSSKEEAQKPHYKLVHKYTLNNWKETRDSIHNNPAYSPEKALKFFKIRKDFIKAFHAAGGTVLIGSDAPQVFNVPGDALHHEMAIMIESGLTPLDILQSASIKPAQFFKQRNNGKVQKGFQANLVLLKQNPLDNIQNTRKIAGVMTRGIWLDEQAIISKKAAIKEQYAK